MHESAGAGLKTTQYSLLSHLVTLAPIRPGELATMDASTLTRNLQVLVAQGWATVDAGIGAAQVAALHTLIDDCLLLMHEAPAGDTDD